MMMMLPMILIGFMIPVMSPLGLGTLGTLQNNHRQRGRAASGRATRSFTSLPQSHHLSQEEALDLYRTI